MEQAVRAAFPVTYVHVDPEGTFDIEIGVLFSARTRKAFEERYRGASVKVAERLQDSFGDGHEPGYFVFAACGEFYSEGF